MIRARKTRSPFILKFAVRRKDIPSSLRTYYDEERQTTMVRVKGRALPLVKSKETIVDLLTKTEAVREQDDYNSTVSDLEFFTKTAAQRESDEAAMQYLELMTKTFVEKEADDASADAMSLVENG